MSPELAWLSAWLPGQTWSPDVSVVVNDDVITYGEIAEKIAPRLDMAAKLYGHDRERFEEEVGKLRSQQIEDLIERKLILHEFTSSGYATNVLEAFIDDQIKKNIRKEYYGDRARFINTLHAEGMTYEMYRRQERENFIVNYMGYQNVDAPKKLLISPLKIEQYYKDHQDAFKVEDQVKLRMIVITQPTDGTTSRGQKDRRGGPGQDQQWSSFRGNGQRLFLRIAAHRGRRTRLGGTQLFQAGTGRGRVFAQTRPAQQRCRIARGVLHPAGGRRPRRPYQES